MNLQLEFKEAHPSTQKILENLKNILGGKQVMQTEHFLITALIKYLLFM